MASTNDPKDNTGCDLIGTHILDPNGDVILVFNSKDTIVSGPLELQLQTAEAYAAGQTQFGSKKRKQPSNTGTEDIEVRVSSRHLSAASPVFEAMLSSKFQEGGKLKKNGTVRIPLPEDPAHGMLVLLDLIYLKSKTVNPSVLMQVATMADKYDLSSITKVIHAKWHNDIQANIPLVFDKATLHWLAIFDTLRWTELRNEMMVLVIPELSALTVYHGQLRLSATILKLQAYRHKVLKDSLDSVMSIVLLYLGECRYKLCKGKLEYCHMNGVGRLFTELHRQGLYPCVQQPYAFSIKTLREKLSTTALTMQTTCSHSGYQQSRYQVLDDLSTTIAKLVTAAWDYNPGDV